MPPQQAHAALETTAASSPPYGGTLAVPPGAIGTMRLLAVGEVTRGRLAGQEEFDEILVAVANRGKMGMLEVVVKSDKEPIEI